jgi:hypothetical protein
LTNQRARGHGRLFAMRRPRLLALLSFAALGCGDDKKISGETVAIEEFPSAGEDAICEQEVRCGQYPDVETCKTVVFVRLQVMADVGSGKVKYDARAAAACLSALGATGCTVSSRTDGLQSCLDAFRGTVAVGGACLQSTECVSRNCNLSACTSACCEGRCEAQSALGQPCADSAAPCAGSTYCKQDLATGVGTCVARLSVGQPCNGLDICDLATACVRDPATGDAMCTHLPAEGEPCPRGVCDNSLDACDATTKLCVPRIAIGGSCASGTCVRYASCDPVSQLCIARVPGGGACDDAASCLGGLPCENGACTSQPDVPACS